MGSTKYKQIKEKNNNKKYIVTNLCKSFSWCFCSCWESVGCHELVARTRHSNTRLYICVYRMLVCDLAVSANKPTTNDETTTITTLIKLTATAINHDREIFAHTACLHVCVCCLVLNLNLSSRKWIIKRGSSTCYPKQIQKTTNKYD